MLTIVIRFADASAPGAMSAEVLRRTGDEPMVMAERAWADISPSLMKPRKAEFMFMAGAALASRVQTGIGQFMIAWEIA